MVLQNGEVAAFGPRDDILGKMVRNASRLGLNPQAKPPGGPAT